MNNLFILVGSALIALGLLTKDKKDDSVKTVDAKPVPENETIKQQNNRVDDNRRRDNSSDSQSVEAPKTDNVTEEETNDVNA